MHYLFSILGNSLRAVLFAQRFTACLHSITLVWRCLRWRRRRRPFCVTHMHSLNFCVSVCVCAQRSHAEVVKATRERRKSALLGLFSTTLLSPFTVLFSRRRAPERLILRPHRRNALRRCAYLFQRVQSVPFLAAPANKTRKVHLWSIGKCFAYADTTGTYCIITGVWNFTNDFLKTKKKTFFRSLTFFVVLQMMCNNLVD